MFIYVRDKSEQHISSLKLSTKEGLTSCKEIG